MSPDLWSRWTTWGTVQAVSRDRDRLGSAGLRGASWPISCPSATMLDHGFEDEGRLNSWSNPEFVYRRTVVFVAGDIDCPDLEHMLSDREPPERHRRPAGSIGPAVELAFEA